MTVFAAFRDDVAALCSYLPHVRSIDVRSRIERGDTVETVVQWRVGANVPAFVRAVAFKGAFEWTDYATWDATTLSVEWRIEDTVVRCAARDVFVPRGAHLTELVLEGAVHVDPAELPVVFGPLRALIARRLERYVADDMPRSVGRVAAAFTEHLRSR